MDRAEKTVAIAGATGNAGREIARAFLDRGHAVRALVRSPSKLGDLIDRVEVREVQLTERASIRGVLDDADWVVSALGRTRQKGGPPRRRVDCDANLDLLAEASRTGIARFGFVSVAMARADHPVAMVRMKGEVEDAIQRSGVPAVVVQPSGYFSDMWEVLQMCRKGTFWAIGDGRMRFNPIDLRDLGAFVVDAMCDDGMVGRQLPIGGPGDYDSFELADLCAKVLGRPVRVRHIPLWLARSAVAMIRPFNRNLWELGDFFVGNVTYAGEELGNDAVLPRTGERRLEDYFRARLEQEALSSVS